MIRGCVLPPREKKAEKLCHILPFLLISLWMTPVPLFFAGKPEEAIARSGDSSRTTHGATLCVDAWPAPLDVSPICDRRLLTTDSSRPLECGDPARNAGA